MNFPFTAGPDTSCPSNERRPDRFSLLYKRISVLRKDLTLVRHTLACWGTGFQISFLEFRSHNEWKLNNCWLPIVPQSKTTHLKADEQLFKGLKEIDNRNFARAYELLAPLADAGNMRAKLNLAQLYHFGWGVPQDGEKAIALYLIVAEQKIKDGYISALAFQSLSTLYACGVKGIGPDPDMACKYRQCALDIGFPM